MKNLLLILVFGIAIISCGNDTTAVNSENDSSEVNETKEVEKVDPKEAYIEKGVSIMKATFKEFSTNLKMQLEKDGPVGAIGFCNLESGNIAEKMSKAHNAEIKRTSFKLRNSKNRPSIAELEVMGEFDKMIKEGKKPKPVAMEKEGIVHFYAPIPVKSVCLNCHGVKGVDIKEDTYAKISELYPKDQAVGYKEGDLRGIWSIKFPK